MTEINFYVSKEIGLNHRFSIAYRLVNLSMQRNLNTYIHTDSEETSNKMDDYIWTNIKTSFIPHDIINNNSPKQTKISISHKFEPMIECDYLINLSNRRPDFFSRFTKVAEILDNTEEIITEGRKRYSFYRDRGYNLNYYKL